MNENISQMFSGVYTVGRTQRVPPALPMLDHWSVRLSATENSFFFFGFSFGFVCRLVRRRLTKQQAAVQQQEPVRSFTEPTTTSSTEDNWRTRLARQFRAADKLDSSSIKEDDPSTLRAKSRSRSSSPLKVYLYTICQCRKLISNAS